MIEHGCLGILAQLISRASVSQHRSLAVFYGDSAWGNELAKGFVELKVEKKILWVGGVDLGLCSHRLKGHAHHVLGDEVDHVILDGHEGIHADDLGALIGVIRAGGLLILLMPPLEKLEQATDDIRFHRRLMGLIQRDKHALVLHQGVTPERIRKDTSARQASVNGLATGHPTEEQKSIIKGISAMLDHDSAVISVIADRGRGKSSVLGMAAAELIRNETQKILITAPRRSAAAQLFTHALRCSGATDEQSLMQMGVRFSAPDALRESRPEADLLMVDEAASIPVQLLEALIGIYPRIVFATTVHGYEGSGRGFELRFSRILDSLRPGWQSYRLVKPIRWAEHDPLESFGFEALLMKAPVSNLPGQKFTNPDECQVERIDRDQIVHDEDSLAQLFGLLVTAHYRTRPYDLQFLLDAPELQIYAVRWQGIIIAVALLAEEGGFDQKTSDAIFAGIRRPQGHLFAQSLSAHIGIKYADQQRYLRVIRIAVHPELQRKGIGHYLVNQVLTCHQIDSFDAIGVSFAANPDIVRFWKVLGFSCVHLGLTREHSTGSHSVMLMRAFNNRGRKTLAEAIKRFAHRYHALRADAYRDLPEDIAVFIEEDIDLEMGTELSACDELLAYSHASRGFEVSKHAVKHFIEHRAADYSRRLNAIESQVLRLRVFEDQDWTTIARQLGLSGRDEVRKILRLTVARLVEQSSDPEVRSELKQWQSETCQELR
jgi:tRNA(Met) cytidine acetyltransferase